MSHFIFTYGTLRAGDYNHYLLKSAKYIGTAKIRGTLVTESGGFPQIKLTVPPKAHAEAESGTVTWNPTDGLVVGEVYECEPPLIGVLDGLEIPYGYKRVEVPVETWDITAFPDFDTEAEAEEYWGMTVNPRVVEVYEYQRSIEGFQIIPSGDWMEWKHGRNVAIQG